MSWTSLDGGKTWLFEPSEEANAGNAFSFLGRVWEGILRAEDSALRAQLSDLIQGAEEFRQGKAETINGLSHREALEVTLTRPYSEFPQWIGQQGLELLAYRDDTAHVDKDYAPFYFDRPWNYEQRTIALTATTKRSVSLQSIHFIVEPDRHKQFELYKAGKLDTCNLTPDDLAIVREDPELSKHLHEFDTAASLVGFIDLHAHPWGNSQFMDKTPLRAAVNHALTREAMGESLGFTPWPHLLPKALKQYIDPPLLGTPTYGLEPDLEAAQEGERLAGHDQASLLPLNMLLSYVDDPLLEQLAINVKDNLDDISIRMRPFPCKTREDALKLVEIGSMDIWLQWIYPAYQSPDAFFYPTLHSSLYGLGGNYGMLKDPEIDEMIEKAQAAPTEAARAK
ncbi:MAG: ABC transporter substrate-binding protein, partial [bacterium]|nr:ABC transporter substrate-binding protein [bacterium]